jgi:hypothetical protein
MILSDFLFSRLSFSFVIELPFLKFIKYIVTLWSIKEKPSEKALICTCCTIKEFKERKITIS